MRSDNHIAFKEWAVVCDAIAKGRQTLILRKGGIQEGRDGFRVAHSEFWLFPTAFHQQPSDVVDSAIPALENVQAQHEPGYTVVDTYVEISDVMFVQNLKTLAALEGRHIWSPQTVEQRFRYRTPGLFVLVLRAHRRLPAIRVEISEPMAGCKSWVDLPEVISTTGLKPILTDSQFESERHAILEALGKPTLTNDGMN